jgi:hypothetical protein
MTPPVNRIIVVINGRQVFWDVTRDVAELVELRLLIALGEGGECDK